ncbi:MAG: hypothetical protein FWC79_08365 [Oscillospiraceae bacterium]|nr:hypothetical protein [Oscillospiraceae bacterium]
MYILLKCEMTKRDFLRAESRKRKRSNYEANKNFLLTGNINHVTIIKVRRKKSSLKLSIEYEDIFYACFNVNKISNISEHLQ